MLMKAATPHEELRYKLSGRARSSAIVKIIKTVKNTVGVERGSLGERPAIGVNPIGKSKQRDRNQSDQKYKPKEIGGTSKNLNKQRTKLLHTEECRKNKNQNFKTCHSLPTSKGGYGTTVMWPTFARWHRERLIE